MSQGWMLKNVTSGLGAELAKTTKTLPGQAIIVVGCSTVAVAALGLWASQSEASLKESVYARRYFRKYRNMALAEAQAEGHASH